MRRKFNTGFSYSLRKLPSHDHVEIEGGIQGLLIHRYVGNLDKDGERWGEMAFDAN